MLTSPQSLEMYARLAATSGLLYSLNKMNREITFMRAAYYWEPAILNNEHLFDQLFYLAADSKLKSNLHKINLGTLKAWGGAEL